jgi:hypothetical protein
VSDSSTVTLNSEDGSADAGAPKVDLSSGTVTAASEGEIFEYSVKFINGVPVATDGNVTISGFDTKVDRLVIKSDSLPAGFGKSNLLDTAGVDVTTDTDGSTRIDFGANADGSSSYLILSGVSDKDLTSIDLVFEVVSPTVVGTQVDIDSASITAADEAETFVYDASWDGDEIVGSDGNVTITGFSLTSDKLVILTGGGVPSGYDRSQFENNSMYSTNCC